MNASSKLVICTASGSPEDVGMALGAFGKAAVHDYLVHTSAWASVMQWRDSNRACELEGLTRELFPLVWRELEGLAQGLALPVEDVFLWNCRGDLWAMAPEGCTTVMSAGPEGVRITHNEDGDPGLAGSCGVALVQPASQPAFASFVYPGSIPGHTFAVTANGLAITVNNIRWLDAQLGVPRMVLTRALLATESVARGVQLLRESPRAGGFHLTIADARGSRLVSVEFGPHVCSVLDIDTVHLHANHAVHPQARNLPQIITGSSGFRQIRGEQLISREPVDPLRVLSDQAFAQYPICRTDPADNDNENTLGNADMRIVDGEIRWDVRTLPHLAPCLSLRNASLIP